MKIKYTQEEDKIIKTHYKQKDGIQIIQQLLPHRQYNSIKGRANYLNLKRKKIYTKDLSFFDKPNLLNCWVSGFISADGCLTRRNKNKNGNTLVIDLSLKDKNYLKIIKNTLKYDGPLTFQTKKQRVIRNQILHQSKMIRLTIYNCKQWCNNLNKYWNLTPAKTYTLQPPNIQDICLQLAFIQGLIEGDGSVYFDYNKHKNHYIKTRLGIYIISTVDMLNWVKLVCEKLVPYGFDRCVRQRTSKGYKNSNLAEYYITGISTYIISKLILSLDLPLMERKWNRAKKYIHEVENNHISKKSKTLIRKNLIGNQLIWENFPNVQFPQKFLTHSLPTS